MLSVGRNDPCPCGSGQKYKKCCADKPLAATAANTRHNTESVSAEVKQKLLEAARLLEEGDPGHALQYAEPCLIKFPENEDCLFLTGLAHARLGNLTEAERLFERAIARQPLRTRSYIMLAGVYFQQHHYKSVLQTMQKAVDIEPMNPTVVYWYGVAQVLNGAPEDAEKNFRKAISLSPKPYEEAMGYLYSVLRRLGRDAEAETEYARLLEHNPRTGIKFSSLFMFPEITRSREHIAEIRAQLDRDMDEVLSRGISVEGPDSVLQVPGFYLAFHGLNDRDIMQKACRFFRQTCPALSYTAPHCHGWQGVPEGRKIRIGFISQYFYNHSVGSYMNSLITALHATGQFEVHVMSFGGKQDAQSQNVFASCASAVHLPITVALASEIIAQKKLDILVYTDIGMNTFSYFLPFYRLAPVQCVMAGHPVTTGIDTVDYFISSDSFEPEGAQEHYSETLLTIPEFTAWGIRPRLPEPWLDRKHFGISEEDRLYFAPMTLQKLHPDNDAVFKKILERDPKARIVLVKDANNPHWHGLLGNRLAEHLGEALAARVTFLDWMSHDEFLSALHFADVLLDPLCFGGGTTFYLIAATGTPFITLPTSYMRGRVGMAFANLLGMPEMIARDEENYVAQAIAIASDTAKRQSLREKMLANNAALYGDTGTVASLQALFMGLAKKQAAAA
ncbi:MAG: tetratricopeptide repeat protein [Alphaproteobacteria bacterium]|nr:tetratricopeptide repeat protein [Alphaproteobacteria bacterium]